MADAGQVGTAWLLGAFHANHYATHLVPDDHPEWQDVNRMINHGNPGHTGYFPPAFYGYYDLGRTIPALKTPPPLFRGYCGVPILTAACAEVLRRFDLGRTTLHPIELLKQDRKTPVLKGDYVGMLPGEYRERVVPQATSLRLKHVGGTTPPRYNTYCDVTDDAIALSPEALEPPDLWIDRRLIDRMFVTDRLGEALVEAGWRDVMKLTRCRVVDADGGEGEEGRSPPAPSLPGS